MFNYFLSGQICYFDKCQVQSAEVAREVCLPPEELVPHKPRISLGSGVCIKHFPLVKKKGLAQQVAKDAMFPIRDIEAR